MGNNAAVGLAAAAFADKKVPLGSSNAFSIKLLFKFLVCLQGVRKRLYLFQKVLFLWALM